MMAETSDNNNTNNNDEATNVAAEGGQEEDEEELEEDVSEEEVEDEESDYDEDEEEDSEEDDDGITVPDLMKEHDPRRMRLSPEHRELALRYKEAAQAAAPELDPVPDLWYAQLAIICGDDIQGGLDRLLHLQQYKEQYKIVDDFAFGRQCMRKYLDTFPGYIMSCHFAEREGCYMLALDMVQFDARELKAQPMVFIQGSYFLEQIGCFELESMRKGIIVLLECQGYNWTEHMGIKVMDQIWTELWTQYPMNIYVMKHFHTGFFMNMMASISKRFIPKEMRQKIQFGCQSAGGRLDETFNRPTLEEAQERLWSQLERLLQKRYENEQTFSLYE